METILDINGNWKQVDNTRMRSLYASEFDWQMSKPNKPGYYRSNND